MNASKLYREDPFSTTVFERAIQHSKHAYFHATQDQWQRVLHNVMTQALQRAPEKSDVQRFTLLNYPNDRECLGVAFDGVHLGDITGKMVYDGRAHRYVVTFSPTAKDPDRAVGPSS